VILVKYGLEGFLEFSEEDERETNKLNLGTEAGEPNIVKMYFI